MALFKARVEIGCSILESSAFMSITYKAGSPRLRVAGCVSRDWRAFWRLLRDDPLRQMKWLRVMELTKKRTPHFHLVIGPTEGQRVRCYSRRFDVVRFRREFDKCGCMSHRASRAWYEVTGDSYIVHAIPVYSAKGAASYLANYVKKDFDKVRGEAYGMKRRWSTSHGWPGSGRLRLAHTEWVRRDFVGGKFENLGGPDDLLERAGNPVALYLAEKKKRERPLKEIIRRLDRVH